MPLTKAIRAALAALAIARGLPALELPSMQAQVRFSADKAEYWRYELVELSLDAAGAPFEPADNPVLEARVSFEGQEAAGLPGKEHAALLWDEDRQMWRGKWPVPWNPKLGVYQAELLAPLKKGPTHSLYAGPGGN